MLVVGNGVVAVLSGPRDGVVAEPFWRFSPIPMDGASLTGNADVGAHPGLVGFSWPPFCGRHTAHDHSWALESL